MNSHAKSRQELYNSYGTQIQVECSHCNNRNYFHINQVTAETASNKTYLAGGGIGIVIGILGGPFGMLLGAAAGGLIGGVVGNKNEHEAVRRFNSNYLQ